MQSGYLCGLTAPALWANDNYDQESLCTALSSVPVDLLDLESFRPSSCSGHLIAWLVQHITHRRPTGPECSNLAMLDMPQYAHIIPMLYDLPWILSRLLPGVVQDYLQSMRSSYLRNSLYSTVSAWTIWFGKVGALWFPLMKYFHPLGL